MSALLSDSLNFLSAQSWETLLGLFWFVVIFEIPRYFLSFVSAAIVAVWNMGQSSVSRYAGSVSVVIAGYNEEEAVERCVLSLREQSLVPDEIIGVSDGSTDNMPAKLHQLQQRGLLDQVHCTDLRAGKSAAINLGVRYATGDVVCVVDCDCTFDRHALRNIVAPMVNPEMGAVSGNILVANTYDSFLSTIQSIEYLIGISLGKRASALIDQVACVSGAFGAFRRRALAEVAGVDAGSGEDLDLTLKLRKAGWDVEFAADAVCYTDVPTSLRVLVNQRLRWERDSIRLRYRKHFDTLNPFDRGLIWKEVFHQLEFLVFSIFGAAIMPLYIIWLFLEYGSLAPTILVAMQAGMMLLDVTAFALAAYVTPKCHSLPLLPYVAVYGIYNGILMRFVRLVAYVQEWLFDASSKDHYVPEKVQLMRRW